MKALVTVLYQNGRRIGHDRKIKPKEGDLNVSTFRHPILGRETVDACLLTDHGLNVVDPMFDVRLTTLAAHGLRLRGTVLNGKGQELAQEWWVRFVGTEGAK